MILIEQFYRLAFSYMFLAAITISDNLNYKNGDYVQNKHYSSFKKIVKYETE